jgi:hypothetical protein
MKPLALCAVASSSGLRATRQELSAEIEDDLGARPGIAKVAPAPPATKACLGLSEAPTIARAALATQLVLLQWSSEAMLACASVSECHTTGPQRTRARRRSVNRHALYQRRTPLAHADPACRARPRGVGASCGPSDLSRRRHPLSMDRRHRATRHQHRHRRPERRGFPACRSMAIRRSNAC